MAKDKNGFLLYKDLIHSVKKLPKDKAGELFMHILQYVNDEDPETDDLLIELAFEPVKQALKRDLKKYEQIKEKNKENARKRWQKVESQTIPSITIASESIPSSATACDRIPTHAKHADIDSDIDSDMGSDSGNEILLEKEPKEKKIIKKVPDEIPDKTRLPEKEKSSAKKEKELIMPDEFRRLWEEWSQYRKDRRFKPYAGIKWEQKAVDNLLELSNKDPAMAKDILEQTYRNNYQGFFKLKQNNGKPTYQNSGFSGNTAGQNGKISARTILAQRLAGKATGNNESGNITIDVEACE